MTEREAVTAFFKAAKRENCTFREYKEEEISKSHIFPESFAVGMRDDIVTFFYFGGGVEPPKEVLASFKHLNKVIIRPATGHSLAWLKYIPSVHSLEIFQWNEEELPTEWDGADNVERLFLETVTGKIPNLVRRMKSLRYLGMDSSQPIELPEWLAQLDHLERLYLRKCVIKKIPESLWRKKDFPILMDDEAGERGIFLNGASLERSWENKDIDINMYRRSFDAMEDVSNQAKLTRYYHNLRIRTFGPLQDPIPECMVIFLGDGSVGKSSLIDRLIDREAPFSPGASSPTNGVRIITWQTTFDVTENGQANPQSLSLRMMDFGGQEIFHSIHRCFMTDNTVYVVVCDSRMDMAIDFNAVRWLDTINTFAPSSPVILALNKVDLNENVSVNEKDLQQRYPGLKIILKTTARSEPEYADKYPLSNLEAEIKKLARRCDNSYRAGASWIAVKQKLENLKKDLNKNYLTEEQYKKICEDYAVTAPDDQREMLKWFKELGVVYSYGGDDTDDGEMAKDLKGVRVLEPQWLSNGIYRIIRCAPENDVLTHEEIRKTLMTAPAGDILPETTYEVRNDDTEKLSFDEPEYILHVMRSVKLSQSADEGGIKKEMIPSRFTKNPPKTVDYFPMEDALHLRWEARYLPNNVVHRLMIKRYDQLQRDCMWRTGAMFLSKADGTPANKDNYDYQALVTLNDESLDLYVAAAQDRNPRKYLWQLREDILSIMAGMNLHAEEYPCWKIPGEDGREIKMSLSRAMLNICNSASPDKAELPADYILITDADTRRGILGAQVVAIDILESVYLYSDDLIRDYRHKLASQKQQSAATRDSRKKKAGYIARLKKYVGRLWNQWRRWIKKSSTVWIILNVITSSHLLLAYTLGVVSVLGMCIFLFVVIGLPFNA